MTELTLQNHHRTVWHFIPGLALSAVITGAALWVDLFLPSRSRVQRPHLSHLTGNGHRQYGVSANLEKL